MSTDNVKMDINIAGERIYLTVPFSRQNAVRDTEKSLQNLYSTWRRDFPQKTDKELLAMMAYQYASFYEQLLQRVEDAKKIAADTDSRLSALLDKADK